MKGYIYDVEKKNVVTVIAGATNTKIENKAQDLGFLGSDEYGLTYSPGFGAIDAANITKNTDYVTA